MTVFRSKTFKKNRPRRISRKMWRKERKTSKRKQRGGYVPYRGNPVGGVVVNPIDWDDNKEKVA